MSFLCLIPIPCLISAVAKIKASLFGVKDQENVCISGGSIFSISIQYSILSHIDLGDGKCRDIFSIFQAGVFKSSSVSLDPLLFSVSISLICPGDVELREIEVCLPHHSHYHFQLCTCIWQCISWRLHLTQYTAAEMSTGVDNDISDKGNTCMNPRPLCSSYLPNCNHRVRPSRLMLCFHLLM